ncbi:MAG: DUF3662 and FHA domain-containing protein [Actinomycetes bacterium]
MGVLNRFERRLDQMVNGAFARAFKAEVQPIEIASALQRECDDKAALVTRGRTIVPNAFTVELGARDHDRLAGYAEPLTDELAGMVREHVGEQGYSLVGPVTVSLTRDESLETGVFRVLGEAEPGVMSDGPLLPHVRLEIGATEWPLTQDVSVVGRGSDADVRIDDPGVSRRHATINLRPVPTISDLGSTNGTRVDGNPVEEAARVELVDGSVIEIGSTTATFRYGA